MTNAEPQETKSKPLPANQEEATRELRKLLSGKTDMNADDLRCEWRISTKDQQTMDWVVIHYPGGCGGGTYTEIGSSLLSATSWKALTEILLEQRLLNQPPPVVSPKAQSPEDLA